MSFSFDAKKEPNKRILEGSVKPGARQLRRWVRYPFGGLDWFGFGFEPLLLNKTPCLTIKPPIQTTNLRETELRKIEEPDPGSLGEAKSGLFKQWLNHV